MGKKNKKKNHQKKKQIKALKSQRRRREYQKLKTQEVTIHWDDLNFLEGWKSLTPYDLMDKVFKMDVEEWVELYPKPKSDTDWLDLQDVNNVSGWMDQTIDDTLKAWASDTNGFTENVPERWQYNEKNQNRFMTLIKGELESLDGVTDEDIRHMMENDRSEWFSVVFSDTLDEIVNVVSPYIVSQVRVWMIS